MEFLQVAKTKGGYQMYEPPSTNISSKNGYMKKAVIRGRMLKKFSDCDCEGKKKKNSTISHDETTSLSLSEQPVSKEYQSSSKMEVNQKLPYQMEQLEISQEAAMKDKTLNKYDSNIKLFLYSLGKKLLQKFPFKNSQSR